MEVSKTNNKKGKSTSVATKSNLGGTLLEKPKIKTTQVKENKTNTNQTNKTTSLFPGKGKVVGGGPIDFDTAISNLENLTNSYQDLDK